MWRTLCVHNGLLYTHTDAAHNQPASLPASQQGPYVIIRNSTFFLWLNNHARTHALSQYQRIHAPTDAGSPDIPPTITSQWKSEVDAHCALVVQRYIPYDLFAVNCYTFSIFRDVCIFRDLFKRECEIHIMPANGEYSATKIKRSLRENSKHYSAGSQKHIHV